MTLAGHMLKLKLFIIHDFLSIYHNLGWPNQLLVQEIWGEGCYLVAKQPKGIDIPEQEKKVFWRLSFSGAEKKLLLHGAHGEEIGCRKQVLRLMKAFRDHMKWVKLTSYHLKTIMLYEYEAHPNPNDWSSECLSVRFIGFLNKLECHLRQANCPHYFIEGVNLLEMVSPEKCSEMAAKVQQLKFFLVIQLLISLLWPLNLNQ